MPLCSLYACAGFWLVSRMGKENMADDGYLFILQSPFGGLQGM